MEGSRVGIRGNLPRRVGLCSQGFCHPLAFATLGQPNPPSVQPPGRGPARGLGQPTRLVTCASAADETALLSVPQTVPIKREVPLQTTAPSILDPFLLPRLDINGTTTVLVPAAFCGNSRPHTSTANIPPWLPTRRMGHETYDSRLNPTRAMRRLVPRLRRVTITPPPLAPPRLPP